ncbi:MAG: DMT family transporter [Rhodospirillales bacterium]|nr:DMT family transporter [Rhodospirillales bacterium]MDE2198809.1 DMT family transporter [Rhodospirillales bacterium]
MPPRLLDRVAPLAFVLLWSSSFIAARVGLNHITPLLFVALRMVVCAVVLVGAMVVLRRPWHVLRGRWLHCAVAGVLINAVLLMTAHVAMTHIQAAPIALVQTLNPLLTALLASRLLGERLAPRQWLGLLLGMTGVVMIVGLAATRSTVELGGLLLTTAGVLSLCAGTLYFGRFCRGVPMLPNAAVQFTASAIVCLLGMLAFEHPRAHWSPGAIAAIAWNVAGVSLGGMALYFVMLTRGTAARTTANFYLVPGVAALLAWAVLGERLGPVTIGGLAVASLGCWLVRRRQPGPG